MAERAAVPYGERCAAEVSSGGWRFRKCGRRGTVEEAGQRWCSQHAPSAVKARREANTKHAIERFQRAGGTAERRALVQDAEAAVLDAAEAWCDLGPFDFSAPQVAERLRDAVLALREARAG